MSLRRAEMFKVQFISEAQSTEGGQILRGDEIVQ